MEHKMKEDLTVRNANQALSRIEPTSLYLVESTINTTLATGSTTSITMCNPGDILFFGTYITLRSDIVDSEYDIPLLPQF